MQVWAEELSSNTTTVTAPQAVLAAGSESSPTLPSAETSSNISCFSATPSLISTKGRICPQDLEASGTIQN